MNELDFIQQFKPGPATSAAEVLARAGAPDLADIQEEQAARAAAEARAEEREIVAMLNQRAGDPIGNVSRCQAVVSEARLQVMDLENKLETARGLLSRASGELAEWSGAVDGVMATAQRSSNVLVDPLQRAQQVAHDAFKEATRAAWAAPASAPQAVSSRRPKGAYGVAVRAEEQPVHCSECQAVGATWEESVMIHHEADVDGVDIPQRSNGGRGPMITR